MRIALTGSSSVGKTTLASSLMTVPKFAAAAVTSTSADARGLLERLGHRSMDQMTWEQTRDFQEAYFRLKREQELSLESFVTDRSFVDVAAYWLERDSAALSEDELVAACRALSLTYDHHFYLPFGVFPFVSDGYRSEDLAFHWRIDRRVRQLLTDWRIPTVTLDTSSLSERIDLVLRTLALDE